MMQSAKNALVEHKLIEVEPGGDLYILSMAVLPSFQGKGIGKKIYKKK